MKIALLTDGIFPYQIGGMQMHSYYLARFLAGQGAEVDVFHPFPNSENSQADPDFGTEAGGRIQLIPVDFPTLPLRFPGHYLINSYRYSRRIFTLLKDRLAEYDLIYIQGLSGWRLLQKKTSAIAVPPICINFHGLEMFQQPANFKQGLIAAMFRPWVKANLIRSDFVQSLGGKLTEILLDLQIKPEQIWEIPIGVGEEWIRQNKVVNNAVRTFAFVGRYERRKGIQELSRLLEESVDTEDFMFHFIGPVPDNLQIESPKIKYWGFVKESGRIRNILQQVDVLVCPSYSEGMPTVIHEAMASGCAVIATDVGAVSLQVDEKVGWLISPAEYDQLQRAFQEAIRLPLVELNAKKERAVSKVQQQFLWDRVITLMLNRIRQSS